MNKFMKGAIIVGAAGMAVMGGANAFAANQAVLQAGDQDQYVKNLQAALRDNGLLTGEATGYYGTVTEAAVTEFQEQNGLEADGVAGPETLKLLLGSDAAGASSTSSSSSSSLLQEGATGDSVRSLQQQLIEHGYLKGHTGYFGNDTLNAVKEFQEANGLKVDGKVGADTLEKLSDQDAVSKKEYIAPIEKGDTNAMVAKAQQQLIDHGYLKGYTGYYGTDTESAIKEFQANNGLEADGVIGDATKAKLADSDAVTRSEAAAAKAAEQKASATSSGLLALGSQSDAVEEVQQLLIKHGYLKGSTGYFGPDTDAAIKEFQANNGLTADGEVGEATLAKLNSSDAVGRGEAAKASSGVGSGLLALGSQSDAVEEVQQLLIKHGYLKGSTGYFGPDTDAAIKEFQANNGLTADGEVGEATLAKLNSSNAVGRGEAAQVASASSTASSGMIKLGSQGDAVTNVQQLLIKHGYLKGYTGYFGPDTDAAVKAFQANNGLTADGEVGEATLAKLNSSSAVTRSQAAANSAAANNNASNSGSNESAASSGTLVRGSQGDAVTKAQKRLTELGYLKGNTGYYGAATERAVSAFQSNNGLSADGKIGPSTSAKLYSSSAKSASSGSSSSGSSSSGSGSSSSGSSSTNSSSVSRFLSAAQSHMGSKYVWGGSGPSVFDCSGFVYYSLREAGVNVSRLSAAGYSQTSSWQTISSIGSLQPGDLLFWRTDRASIGHTGIYLGGGQFIHASSSQGKVVISSIHTNYWTNNFVRAKRVF